MTKYRELQRVEIIWQDIISGLTTLTLKELEETKLPINKSTGYLIKKDKEKVVLAFCLFGGERFDEEEDEIKHWQVIPMCNITGIKILKVR